MMKEDEFKTRYQKDSARVKAKREAKIRDIFYAEKLEIVKGKRLHIALPESTQSVIQDIRELHSVDAWKYVPDIVVDALFGEQMQLNDEDPFDPTHILKDREVVRIALDVLRLYLLGCDSYNRRLMRKIMTMDGKELLPTQIAANVESGAKYSVAFETLLELRDEYEEDLKDEKKQPQVDDKFDFSGLDFLEE
tara:strand:- start:151 stop:729 length:579 start_codon:yes stop_codon:yes gene_type:complete